MRFSSKPLAVSCGLSLNTLYTFDILQNASISMYIMLNDLYCWPGLFACYYLKLQQVSRYFTNFYLLSLIKGKSQVGVGVAQIDLANKSSESALSIFPLAIANCKEDR